MAGKTKRDKWIFVPNKWFKFAVVVMFVTAIFLIQGLRRDNVFLLIFSIFLGAFGLVFIDKSLKYRAKKLKK